MTLLNGLLIKKDSKLEKGKGRKSTGSFIIFGRGIMDRVGMEDDQPF